MPIGLLQRVKRWVTNQDLTNVEDSARALIRERLNRRERWPLDEISGLESQTTNQLERANSLLIRLGEVAGVDPGVFRPEMTLDHELGIDRSELDPAARQVLDKYEIGERMQPFAYDVFAMMEEYVKKERWKQVADTMTPRPRGEEEWIDAIMGMTVAGWLAAFAQ